MREIRTLRATWRGLETWHGRDVSARPARQSSTLPVRGALSDERPYRDPGGPFVRSYGAGGEVGTIAADQSMECPDASPERSEPLTSAHGAGEHLGCRHRDEPVELAGCRGGPGNRAAADQEARARRAGAGSAASEVA